MKVALVHDWLTNLGGGERVLAALHVAYPDAPIYTSVYRPAKLGLFKDATVHTSFLQHWPLAKRKHQLFPELRTLAFESFDFSGYDVVISSSSAEAKGIIVPTETLHISYIHTPTRYYWSGYEDYLREPGMGLLSPVARWELRRTVKKARHWDYAAAQRPDILVANSATVQKRIQTYYERDSVIVFPPIDTTRFRVRNRDGTYYLVVSRLIPYKRTDLAVKACTQLSLPLKVVGSGSELKKLRSMAGQTIEFIEEASDKDVTRLMEECKALLFTAFEDFGITPVEAMSAGRPVIGYGKGGASETIVDGETGVLFDHQTVQSLIDAIKEFEHQSYSADKIRIHAEQFSQNRFIAQMKQRINSSVPLKRK